LNPNCNGNRHDKTALSTACIKIRTGRHYVEYFYYSKNLNWATQNLRLGRMRATGWT